MNGQRRLNDVRGRLKCGENPEFASIDGQYTLLPPFDKYTGRRNRERLRWEPETLFSEQRHGKKGRPPRGLFRKPESDLSSDPFRIFIAYLTVAYIVSDKLHSAGPRVRRPAARRP